MKEFLIKSLADALRKKLECSCGRPRATAEDLARWNSDPEAKMRMVLPGRNPQEGCHERDVWIPPLLGHAASGNPEWARALCWTKADAGRCNMRRRWASDTHIEHARDVFEAYIDATARIGDPAWWSSVMRC